MLDVVARLGLRRTRNTSRRLASWRDFAGVVGTATLSLVLGTRMIGGREGVNQGLLVISYLS